MDSTEVEILLVDDSPCDVELTIYELRRHHLANKIHVAEDGEQALDFLFCRAQYTDRSFERPPKLILLDLKLPKVDGLEVLEAVKRDSRTQAIPVVMLTSSKQQTDLANSYRLGVNSYIQKPVDFGQFEDAIRQLGLYRLVINALPPAGLFQGKSHQF
jgi:two-component system response regulator